MPAARHTHIFVSIALLLSIVACSPGLAQAAETVASGDATSHDENRGFQKWLEELAAEAVARGVRAEVVREALEGLQPEPTVITPRHKQAEFALPKREYVRQLASEHRFREGLKKLAQHRNLLQRIADTYGVAPHYLVALWAIESDFGQGGSRFPVIRALVTQAYQGERQAFFRKQLLAALAILDREGMRSEQLRGSWAGAMGHFQFIPTTYLDYAVDFNGDGRRNIWTDIEDALASAASFMARAGWEEKRGWGRQIEIPAGFDLSLAGLDSGRNPDAWRKAGLAVTDEPEDRALTLLLPDGPEGKAYLVTGNFRVLMRWNRAVAFALAVGHLADRLEAGAPVASAP